MQSVWASLSRPGSDSTNRGSLDNTRSQPKNNQHVAPHVRAQQPAVSSIWSQSLRSSEVPSNPSVQLFHPRYEPNSQVAKKLVQQNQVKPLVVPPSYGSAGLEEHPQYDSILWPDTTRARLPLRSPHLDEQVFFNPPPHLNPPPAIMKLHAQTTPQERIPYTGSLISDSAAIHPPPPANEAAVLSGLQLTNIGTHIPHPDQLMPFTSLVAGLTPAPLSDAGFKPLNIASIENRWNRVLGLPSAVSEVQKAQLMQRDGTIEQEVQTDQMKDVQQSIQIPLEHHRDVATSPMGKELSAQAHQTYSLAFSPQHSPRSTSSQPTRATHSRYEFPPAPAGVNPDAYLTHQAEHLHQFSIRALKHQIEELKKDGRAIEKEQRASDKDTLYREHKWNELVGLSTVQESISEGLDLSSSNYLEEADAALRHALTLEDEKVVATQTDATLSLQHALKPRMAGRKGTLRHADDLKQRQTMQQAIEKEVAAEYALKEAEAFGVKPPSNERPRGTALLPKFQSQADQYREQLREQYRVLFEAKLASQASHDSVAGQLVEARLKKLRDDTLFAANPYRMTAAVKQKKQENEMKDPAYRMPDTIIGSRTAALLFVDPVMMYRKTNPQHVAEQQTRIPVDPSTQVPNKVEELTKRNAEELKSHIGFEIPAPTFVGSGTTHRQLKFASAYSDSGELIPIAKSSSSASAPPPINVAQVAPSTVLEEPPINAESNLDHLNIFGGKKPLQVLKHEFSDLDEDVHKLEQTIRMLHAEFAAPAENVKPATQQPPPVTHALVPTYQEVQAKQIASMSASTKAALLQGHGVEPQQLQREASIDPRHMQSAQRILHSVDNVLGVSGSALSRSPPRPVSSNRPMSLIQQYQQLQQQQNDISRPQTNSARPATSKLVQALEKYLSLDMSFDALSQSSKASAHSTAVKDSLHSFPSAPHDLNRPPEFTSQNLSPSLLREREEKENEARRIQQQQRETEEKQAEEHARRKHERERHHSHSSSHSSSRSHHYRSSHSHSQSHSESRSHHSNEPHSPSQRRHSEIVSPKHSSRSSNSRSEQISNVPSSSPHARTLTPSSSMRHSHSTLARVVEGDQETSHSNVGTGDIHGLSIATGDDEEDEGPDSALDHSRIITLDSHAQPSYDDSTDSIHHAALISPAYSNHQQQQHPHQQQARPLTHVQINRRPMSPPYPPGGPPRSQSVIQHPAPPPSATGPRSPNSARRRVSVPHAATTTAASGPVSSLHAPEVTPRTNRSAELRKHQLDQAAAHANLIAARAAGRPASSVQRKPLSPPPSASAAASTGPSGAAARKSGIELERERLRMKKQRVNPGMMQLTHSRDFQQQAHRSQQSQPQSVNSSVNQSFNASSPLETSTDRQIADVNNMMANFRQLLDDLPAPAPRPYIQNQQQQHHDETPQSTYRDPFDSDEVWPTPTPLNDSDFHNRDPMSTSWEDEFRHDDVLRDEEPTPAATLHNPLDDYD